MSLGYPLIKGWERGRGFEGEGVGLNPAIVPSLSLALCTRSQLLAFLALRRDHTNNVLYIPVRHNLAHRKLSFQCGIGRKILPFPI